MLTLLLICQEVYEFVILRPTGTSAEERDLESGDFPDVVVCLEPGFKSRVLERNGYVARKYYKGEIKKRFVGWNGNETKSYDEILEEALVIGSQHITKDNFISKAVYRGEDQKDIPIRVKLITLLYPYGRCFHISPSDIQGNLSVTINTLQLIFNETAIDRYRDRTVKIYFMERFNSLQIYPDENYMEGDTLKIRTNQGQRCKSTYKIKITRSEHVQDDPLLKCEVYQHTNYSYDDCARNELLDSFHQLLGCTPPLLEKDPSRICNQRFNISMAGSDIRKLFLQMYQHDMKFKCKTPCTKDKYTAKLVHKVPTSVTIVGKRRNLRPQFLDVFKLKLQELFWGVYSEKWL